MIDKEQFHNRARFQGDAEERESRGHTLETVATENAQKNFCGEIKGTK